MRMDQRQELTAAKLVNEASAEELARIFWEFGGERESRRFARAIVMDREARPFETTRQLAELIERLSPAARTQSASGDENFSGAADRGERRDWFFEAGFERSARDFEARRPIGGDHVS